MYRFLHDVIFVCLYFSLVIEKKKKSKVKILFGKVNEVQIKIGKNLKI